MSLESDLILALVRAADGDPVGGRPPRLDRIHLPPDCALIPLKGGLAAIVDTDELDFLSRWKWQAVRSERKDGPVYYAIGGSSSMHRKLLAAPKGLVVDHWNGDTLDNRRANLRLCTQRENSLNRRTGGAAGGYRGVRPAGRGRWSAVISDRGSRVQLGIFDSPTAAARAYDEACRKLHRAFAMTNFPAPRKNT